MRRPPKDPVCPHCLEKLTAEEPCQSCAPDEPESDCWLCEGRGAIYGCRNARCGGREVQPEARSSAEYGYMREPAEPPRAARGQHHSFENGRCTRCGKPRSLAERYGWRCAPED